MVPYRFCLLVLVLVLSLAAPSSAQDEPPPRPASLMDGGRLLATSGITSVEGAGGGGLVPWAVITGYGSRDGVGANVHATGVRLTDFNLATTGASIGLYDRVELSFQHQWFDTGRSGGRLGLGNGYSFQQDVAGVKVRLFGDVVADQDSWWPQVALGVQGKFSRNGDVVRLVGARDSAGVDFYVAATKLLLREGVLLNGTVRLTRANQFGLLGFGGEGHDGYRPQFEGSAALLLGRGIAVGAEYRTKPDNLRFAKEGNAFSVFGVWFLSRNLSATAALVGLGPVANQGRQTGALLSLQTGF